MGTVHFVGRHKAPALCGAAEDRNWIETLRAAEVTCERCLERLAGARRRDEERQRDEAAAGAPA